MEHIGDMCAISSTVGKDFLKEPGLHRTLMGDGLALAALVGVLLNAILPCKLGMKVKSVHGKEKQ